MEAIDTGRLVKEALNELNEESREAQIEVFKRSVKKAIFAINENNLKIAALETENEKFRQEIANAELKIREFVL